MNVYDFDKTVYNGDCTVDFWRFCIKKHPKAIRRLPKAFVYAVLFKLGICKREKFKETFYRFLRDVPDVPSEVKLFWDENAKKIKPWYLAQKQESDLIISASPDFIISEISNRLSVASIASEVDIKTGNLLSKNCRSDEKVRRFYELYPESSIDEFYSDSKSDLPLAKISKKAYLVKKTNIKVWEI